MPTEVSEVQPGPTGTISIHERAMSIEFLEHITQMFGLTHCATRAVQTSVIIPHTRGAKTNYAQALHDGKLKVDLKLPGSCVATSMGRATVFVSHGWDSQWAKLISALRSDHDARQLSAGGSRVRVYYWIDLFAVSQHWGTQEQAAEQASDLKQLEEVIEGVSRPGGGGGTLVFCDPWRRPTPVTRVWCLFEMERTISAGGALNMALAPKDVREFQGFLGTKVDELEADLEEIDVRNADATQPDDKTRIFAQIEETVGFDTLNRRITAAMRTWLAYAGEASVKRRLGLGGADGGGDSGVKTTLDEWLERHAVVPLRLSIAGVALFMFMVGFLIIGASTNNFGVGQSEPPTRGKYYYFEIASSALMFFCCALAIALLALSMALSERLDGRNLNATALFRAVNHYVRVPSHMLTWYKLVWFTCLMGAVLMVTTGYTWGWPISLGLLVPATFVAGRVEFIEAAHKLSLSTIRVCRDVGSLLHSAGAIPGALAMFERAHAMALGHLGERAMITRELALRVRGEVLCIAARQRAEQEDGGGSDGGIATARAGELLKAARAEEGECKEAGSLRGRVREGCIGILEDEDSSGDHEGRAALLQAALVLAQDGDQGEACRALLDAEKQLVEHEVDGLWYDGLLSPLQSRDDFRALTERITLRRRRQRKQENIVQAVAKMYMEWPADTGILRSVVDSAECRDIARHFRNVFLEENLNSTLGHFVKYRRLYLDGFDLV
eukprot:gene10046-11888_t